MPIIQFFCLIILYSAFISAINAAKILIFVPAISNSQLIFNYRFGDMLSSHGHDVTMYVMVYSHDAKVEQPKMAKELKFAALSDPEIYRNLTKSYQANMFQGDPSISQLMEQFKRFQDDILLKGCEAQLADKNLYDQLKRENFDIAISHMYDLCPIGMIKALEIPTFIWMSSGSLLDFMGWAVGVPSPSSYVPNFMSSYSDKMTLVERMQNFLGVSLFHVLYDYMAIQPQVDLFRKYYGSNFPSVYELARKSPLIFVNSEELLDFARPILHKIVYVGGIDMNKPAALDEKWQKIVNDSEQGFVFFSLGSVAKASAMPKALRESFVTAFSKFPQLTFIWKFESEVPEAANMKNIVLTKWAPQKDLLNHPKAKVFITHCGYNSFLESAVNGVPMISIPLFGDQPGNSKRAEKLGIGITVDKNKITAENIEATLRNMLEKPAYRETAKKIAKMLKTKPIKSEELAVGWIEYLAEFKNLTHLQPVSIELNLVEYFLIDVIATLSITIIFMMYVCFCSTRYLIRKLCCPQKFQRRRNRLGYVSTSRYSYSE